MIEHTIPPLRSWQEFLDAATRPPSIAHGSGRNGDDEWAGASWAEALRLATDGWSLPLQRTDVTVGERRRRAGLGAAVTTLEPTWDVTGSEVDVGAYLTGVPECMVDAVPRRTSSRGRVVTFVIPAAYSHLAPHESIINRGVALATLYSAIIEAGHSVEIWSGFAGMVGDQLTERCHAVARVVSAGEPLHLGRIVFAAAHPAMNRRLWFAVWDGRAAKLARLVESSCYGYASFDCLPTDLPAGITDPYIFPYLEPDDPQWCDMDTALAWCTAMFADLGLVRATSG